MQAVQYIAVLRSAAYAAIRYRGVGQVPKIDPHASPHSGPYRHMASKISTFFISPYTSQQTDTDSDTEHGAHCSESGGVSLEPHMEIVPPWPHLHTVTVPDGINTPPLWEFNGGSVTPLKVPTRCVTDYGGTRDRKWTRVEGCSFIYG
jgi:hypothetical protein